MAFIESPRFPEDISYGVSFGPEFSTSIASVISGREIRNQNRTRALCVGECSHALKTKAQFDVLLRFFRSMGGRFHAFRFKDWSDYICEAQHSRMTLISGNNYQLEKVYQAAIGFNEIRKISKPVVDTVTVFRTRSGTTTDITSTCVINFTTGVVTVSNHQAGDVYTWEGQFDVPCRFDSDRMAVNIPNPTGFDWGQIPIKEIIV